MIPYSEPPPWAYEVCPGCGCDVSLQKHDLTCWRFDPHTRVAVAWICERCDQVLDIIGLYTSWAAAISACQQELDHRQARYFGLEIPP
jgi:hypothetical protein